MLENKLFKFEEGVVSRWASYEMAEKELLGLH